MFRAIALTSLFIASSAAYAADEGEMGAQHSSATHVQKSANVVAFEKGRATGEYDAINQMMHKNMQIIYTGDADTDFVLAMIPHHQAAVEMANTAIKYARDPRMIKLAKQIKKTQEVEIDLMNQWLNGRQVHVPFDDANSRSSVIAYKAAMEKMHAAMPTQYANDPDIDFARGMVPHHQAAVDMAVTLKQWSGDLMLNKMADDIILTQDNEIGYLKHWLFYHPEPIVY